MSKLKSSWRKTACAVLVLGAATAVASPAQTFTTLATFDGTNGANPFGMSLIQGPDGSLYGTTEFGGMNGDGTVFKVTRTGELTTLHSFNYTDGGFPFAGLVLGADGNFYGTTFGGGANGYGTVFKINSGGMLTTLYSFCAQENCTDGTYPEGALVQAPDGNFYGTTYQGGPNGAGTVFRVDRQGVLTTLHSFDYTDGAEPGAGLVLGSDGNLYGTAQDGGAYNRGAIFRIAPSGTLTTLYSFCSHGEGCPDGYTPVGALIEAADGNLYGTTDFGGSIGDGTVFRISLGGALTTLHSFDSTDGANPFAGLVQATNGVLFGTAQSGGAHDFGTIFKVTPQGAFTSLLSFATPGGVDPYGGLVQATTGVFYGTTNYGGGFGGACTDRGCGTVFSLDVALGPFVETVPTLGMIGRRVLILGNNLTGVTSVTFNGTPATFTVVSSTLITTTVPVGATTGPVQVTTPSGTLTSNVNFRVR
jgi:uncharacterized repeat protein (TIGR03803 family)